MEFTPTDCPIPQQFIEDIFNNRTDLSATGPTQNDGDGNPKHAIIDSVTSELNINGNGYMSDITRLKIKWSNIPDKELCLEYPRSVILKQPSGKRLIGPGIELESLMEQHNHEHNAYAFFGMFPEDQDRPPLVRCYHRQRMTTEGDGLFVMEDLSHIAGSPKGRLLTYDQAVSVVKCLAMAQSYGIRHAKEMGDLFVRLADMQFNPYLNQMDSFMDPVVLLAAIKPHFPEECAYLTKHLHKALAAVKHYFKSYQVPKPSDVLCLGDVTASNLLFRFDPHNQQQLTADLAAIIDFQICHIGNVASDLGFFLAFSFSAKHRRTIEQKLLHLFHDSMKSKIPNYEKIWSFDSLMEGYKKSLTLCAVIILFRMDNSVKRFEENKTAATEEAMRNRMEKVMGLFEDGVTL